MEAETRAEAVSIETFLNIVLAVGFIMGLYIGAVITYTVIKIL